MTPCCIISFWCWSGFGMLLLGKTQKKHLGTFHPRYQTCTLHTILLVGLAGKMGV